MNLFKRQIEIHQQSFARLFDGLLTVKAKVFEQYGIGGLATFSPFKVAMRPFEPIINESLISHKPLVRAAQFLYKPKNDCLSIARNAPVFQR